MKARRFFLGITRYSVTVRTYRNRCTVLLTAKSCTEKVAYRRALHFNKIEEEFENVTAIMYG